MATTGILTNPDVEVDVGYVSTTLERYGIELPKRASVKKLVALLRNAYKSRLEGVPEDEWIKCLVCGELTDDDEELDACPYCGDDGADEDEAEAAEEAGLESPDDEEDVELDVEEPEKLDDDADPDAAEKRKERHEKAEKGEGIDVDESPEDDVTEEATAVDLDADDQPDEDPDEQPDEEPESEPEIVDEDLDDEPTPTYSRVAELGAMKLDELKAIAKKLGVRTSGKIATLANRIAEAELEGEDDDDDAIAVVESETIDASTPGGQLALATQRAKVAQRSIATSGWDLGNILREINEGELWKAGGFSSFKDYHTGELGISKALAYSLMDVAKKFSRAVFEEVGIKKLEIVARAPKESREKLLNEAKTTSKRDLAKKAKEEKAKKKETKSSERPAAPPPEEEKSPTQAAGKRGRPTKEDQTITLLTKVGGAPKSYRFCDSDTHEEIPAWTKDAYVKIPISDDVMLYIAPKTDRSGEKITKLAVMFRKIEDDAAGADSE